MESTKKIYTTPYLTVHGNIESVTRSVNRPGSFDFVYPSGFFCEPNSLVASDACASS